MQEIGIGEFARRSRLSVKALRLYDELGLLVPARVDQASGYRYYDRAQLEQARLVAMLRQLEMPLVDIKDLLACDPADGASRIAEYWGEVEAAHSLRRDLADYLVNRLSSERPLPRLSGREGATFCIWWGEVNADSDGPLEWCRPIPAAQAEALAPHYPELSLRIEPAHREAFIALPDVKDDDTMQWQVVSEALRDWAEEYGIDPKGLNLGPEDLGVRITYFVTQPVTKDSVPDRDFAVPFA